MNKNWERLTELNVLIPYMGNLLNDLQEQKRDSLLISYIDNEYAKLCMEQNEIINSLHNHI
jgi:hypothetical protein